MKLGRKVSVLLLFCIFNLYLLFYFLKSGGYVAFSLQLIGAQWSFYLFPPTIYSKHTRKGGVGAWSEHCPQDTRWGSSLHQRSTAKWPDFCFRFYLTQSGYKECFQGQEDHSIGNREDRNTEWLSFLHELLTEWSQGLNFPLTQPYVHLCMPGN